MTEKFCWLSAKTTPEDVLPNTQYKTTPSHSKMTKKSTTHTDTDSQTLVDVLEALEPHKAFLDAAHIDDLRELQTRFDKNIAVAREEGRALRIAVVGQMKAGKSSFLNAALLDRDLLPRAATPMTAALTRIHYASSPGARVVFYNADDWRGIENEARQAKERLEEEKRKWKEGQQLSTASPFAWRTTTVTATASEPEEAQLWQCISQQLRASWELVEQVRINRLDLNGLLDHPQEIQAKTQEELATKLRDYIGAQGVYTPLVKMIELYVNDPRIEGMEIVDTPGFNDPVVSRGNITRKYLGQCDVIYLFSAVGQFLAAADLALLREQLPSDGIKENAVFIVGSRRDEALRQDANLVKDAAALVRQKGIAAAQVNRATLEFALQLADKKTWDSGKQAIARQLQEANTRGDDRSLAILNHLRDVKPYCVAAQLALWANHLDSLDSNDRYHIDHLQKALGQPLDAEALRVVANIEPLQQELLAQRQRKQELLAQKEGELRKGLHESARKRLQDLHKALSDYADSIKNKGVSELVQQRNDATTRLRAGRGKVEDVFDSQITKIQHNFARLKNEFQALATESVRIESRTDTQTRSYQVKTSSWYKPWSWGSSETRYETITTQYADVQDAVENIDRFAIKTRRDVSEEIMRSIDLDKLRSEASQAALTLFDLGDASFDGGMMMVEINKSLRRLTIPDATLEQVDYSSRLISEFGASRVNESQISDLRSQTRQLVGEILREIGRELDSKLKEIVNGLNSAGSQLVGQLITDIQQSINQLCHDIENKEASLAAIEQAKNTLDGLIVRYA